MIRYAELVDYIKRNHVNWNTDLFDILRGFFEEYSSHNYSLLPTPSVPPIKQELIISEEFQEPTDGEYTTQDILNLFST